MTKILLVRHAYTGISEKNQLPDSPLSKKGRLQAEKLAKIINQNHKFHVIYSSFYRRARQTAEIIAADQHAEVRETDSLNEIGVWTSPTQLHSPNLSPAKYRQELAVLKRSQRKAVGFLEELSQRHPNETVVVVCHGNIIRGMIAAALDAGVETVVRMKVDLASLSILEYEGRGKYFRLTLFNDTAHLSS